MSKLRAKLLVGVLGLGAALVVASGCADGGATAPQGDRPDLLLGSLTGGTLVPVLERNQALDAPITVSRRFDRRGGTIEIPAAGLRLDIPSDALVLPTRDATVRITVTALPGKHVAYTFEPHGLQFREPVSFEQSLKNTAPLTAALLPLVQGGYFLGEVDDGAAVVTEFRPTEVDLGTNRIRFFIEHFSGYLVAAG